MTPRQTHTAALLVCALISGALVSCVTSQQMQVKTRHDAEADFAALETFRFSSTDHSGARFPGLIRATRESIDAELVKRGYERADEQPADFWVDFELILRGERSVAAGDDVRRSQAEAEPAAASGYSRSGTLIVKILGSQSKEVLWHGVLTGITPDPLLAKEELRRATWRLLAEFPPLSTPES